MKKFFILLFLFIFCCILSANDLYTVENPTASVLSKGEARVTQKLFKNNGMMITTDVGLFNSFQFGLAYGVEDLVGDNKPKFYDYPAFKLKFRFIEETLVIPAIAVGVDTQGSGAYDKHAKRYDIKSKGVYFVASKNYNMLGLIGLDFGINYTFEEQKNGIRNWDTFCGLYKSIGQKVTVYFDYTAGLNDNYRRYDEELHDISNFKKGYLGAALQIQISEQFALKFLLQDLLENQRTSKYFDRSILLDYRWFF